jgi:hypothetical protein
MAEYYKISGDTLKAIADHTRTMAGVNRKLTPAEIIYWLGRVIYIPQGVAISEFSLSPITFDSATSARNPVVVKGTATSEFSLASLVFESNATGTLQEG